MKGRKSQAVKVEQHQHAQSPVCQSKTPVRGSYDCVALGIHRLEKIREPEALKRGRNLGGELHHACGVAHLIIIPDQ